MTEQISILVTAPVTQKYPKFVGRLGREHHLSMVGLGEVISRVQHARWEPARDLMLVDRHNLLLASTWNSALSHLGAEPPALLVVQDAPSTALRVMAAHAGARGVLDPLAEWSTITDDLNAVLLDRVSGIFDHPIWDDIESPLDPFALEVDIKDDTDRDIVDLVTLGLSDREVAAGVHLAEQTVRNRLSRILESSGLKNRTQLAVARRRHLESAALASAIPWLRTNSAGTADPT
jgi:DNA-binding CsgD family transcriptional regulator